MRRYYAKWGLFCRDRFIHLSRVFILIELVCGDSSGLAVHTRNLSGMGFTELAARAQAFQQYTGCYVPYKVFLSEDCMYICEVINP